MAYLKFLGVFCLCRFWIYHYCMQSLAKSQEMSLSRDHSTNYNQLEIALSASIKCYVTCVKTYLTC